MWMYVGMGWLLVVLALPLYFEKIPPNGLYGFRVRKTMEDPLVWYPVNKYSSRWLMATGIITALAALFLYQLPGISLDVYALACLSIFIPVFTTGLIFSLRFMNSL